MNDPLATVNDPLWPALEGEGVDLLSLFPRTPSMAAIQQKPRSGKRFKANKAVRAPFGFAFPIVYALLK